MENTYDFGRILLTLREKKGLTQNQLALRLGLKKSTISKYESSIAPPPALMVRKIAKEFGVTSDYMLGIESPGSLSLIGLTEEQQKLVTELAELYRAQNNGIKRRLSPEQFEMLGRITASFVKE